VLFRGAHQERAIIEAASRLQAQPRRAAPTDQTKARERPVQAKSGVPSQRARSRKGTGVTIIGRLDFDVGLPDVQSRGTWLAHGPCIKIDPHRRRVGLKTAQPRSTFFGGWYRLVLVGMTRCALRWPVSKPLFRRHTPKV
jgi:hypothetical protein